MKGQHGLSLVELLIALALGSVIALGLTTLFVNNASTQATQQALARVQENGRFALHLLTEDIRRAGQFGCGKFGDLTLANDLDNNNFYTNFSQALSGFDATGTTPGANAIMLDPDLASGDNLAQWAPVFPNSANFWNNAVQGSDVLVVRGAINSGLAVINNQNNRINVQGNVANNCVNGQVCNDDYAVVADCAKAHVFQVTTTNGAAVLNHNGGWGDGTNWLDNFGPTATVSEVQTRAYYVRLNPNQEPALYRQISTSAGNTAEELIDGVENIQLLYGEDLNNDRVVDRYLTADQITDFNNVYAIRISLLMRSIEPAVAPLQRTYILAGTPFNTPNTGDSATRLRQVFTTTIQLRNN